MEIQYFGQSCFRIKGKKVALVTDPFTPSHIGFKLPKITAEIVTVSHDHLDHNNFSQIMSTPAGKETFVVQGPGEYEISGVSIFGLPSFHDNSQGSKLGENTIYIINIDDIRVVHLGDLGHKLDNSQLEVINGAEILFIPVGGTYTLGAKEAVEVVSQIEPSVVIPMHYKLPGIKFNLAPLQDFLSEIEKEDVKPISKLLISKDKIPEEQTIVVLEKR